MAQGCVCVSFPPITPDTPDTPEGGLGSCLNSKMFIVFIVFIVKRRKAVHTCQECLNSGLSSSLQQDSRGALALYSCVAEDRIVSCVEGPRGYEFRCVTGLKMQISFCCCYIRGAARSLSTGSNTRSSRRRLVRKKKRPRSPEAGNLLLVGLARTRDDGRCFKAL